MFPHTFLSFTGFSLPAPCSWAVQPRGKKQQPVATGFLQEKLAKMLLDWRALFSSSNVGVEVHFI